MTLSNADSLSISKTVSFVGVIKFFFFEMLTALSLGVRVDFAFLGVF
jgi:hypothetical protein